MAAVTLRRPWSMLSVSATVHANVASAAMQTMPAARPSRPSTKFTALMATTTIRMVMVVCSVLSRLMVLPLGSGTHRRVSLNATSSPAAAICPPSLMKASIPHQSSRKPISTITPPARASAMTVLPSPIRGSASLGPMWSNWLATNSPASMPAYIARPPRRGVRTVCTSLSRISGAAPMRSAKTLTSGTSR